MERAKALAIIHACLKNGRYLVKDHFLHRLDQRGLFWADVQALIDAPRRVRGDGEDQFDRPRCLISGTAPDGLQLAFLVVIDEDARGKLTVFITIYHED